MIIVAPFQPPTLPTILRWKELRSTPLRPLVLVESLTSTTRGRSSGGWAPASTTKTTRITKVGDTATNQISSSWQRQTFIHIHQKMKFKYNWWDSSVTFENAAATHNISSPLYQLKFVQLTFTIIVYQTKFNSYFNCKIMFFSYRLFSPILAKLEKISLCMIFHLNSRGFFEKFLHQA